MDPIPVVCILGSIAVGKSTLLKNIREYAIHANLPYEIITIEECLNLFTSYKEHNPLELAYKDPAKNAAITQSYFIESLNSFLCTQLEKIRDEYKNSLSNILIVSDRTLYSPNVFSKALYERGIISEFAYEYLTDTTIKQAEKTLQHLHLKYVGAMFLKSAPETSMARILDRNRQCEIEGVTVEYLRQLNSIYAEHVGWWRCERIEHSNLFTEVDTNSLDENQTLEQMKELINLVMK